MGVRLAHSSMSYGTKHSALLPGKHRLTELLLEHTHRTYLHSRRQTLQYIISQNFWILGAHQTIKRCLSRCYHCFRAKPRGVQPSMADLPSDRQAKPFSVTGVDYTGPFLMHHRRARGVTPNKIYVCIFVCFAVKAVHWSLLSHYLSNPSWLH